VKNNFRFSRSSLRCLDSSLIGGDLSFKQLCLLFSILFSVSKKFWPDQTSDFWECLQLMLLMSKRLLLHVTLFFTFCLFLSCSHSRSSFLNLRRASFFTMLDSSLFISSSRFHNTLLLLFCLADFINVTSSWCCAGCVARNFCAARLFFVLFVLSMPTCYWLVMLCVWLILADCESTPIYVLQISACSSVETTTGPRMLA